MPIFAQVACGPTTSSRARDLAAARAVFPAILTDPDRRRPPRTTLKDTTTLIAEEG